jgi:hypothetical protein
MANTKRNFIAGKMNKVVDERLIPDGQYIDALNIRMGSTEQSEIGVIENTKGNLSLTALTYIDGTPLSADARCIGSLADGEKETIYWFIHDSNFPVGATGKLDMIVSFDVLTNVLTYHIISINDGGGDNTTLNFNPKYLITGINIVKTGNIDESLLFFTDDYNPPRVINVRRGYGNPVANIDQFSAESILVVKKPPVESPAINPIITGSQDNFIQTRFICFAYRYQYQDGEYSATSQFSAPAFIPNPFQFSIDSYLNEGMINRANAVEVTYNSGGPLVVGVDLLFKEADGNVIRVIEKLDKANLGLSDNTEYTYTFNNSKIFTILPTSELLRLYDNVPLLAKAQTLMGNRLMYGNYVEGYDLVDKDGFPVKFEYYTELITEIIGETQIDDSTSTGTYNIDGAQTIPASVFNVDLAGANLVSGSAISVEFTFNHQSFSGGTPFPVETASNISLTFSFYLSTSYSSVYALATSTEFQEAVGTASNIKPVFSSVPGTLTSCDGTTLTDQVNCAAPNNLDALIKFASGINGVGEPIGIITSPASTVIGFQLPAMEYVDNTTTPTQQVYEYYEVTFVEATFQEIANPQSLHSNRDYEIGIVYMDEFNRSTTALVSPNNTTHIPCAYSANQNSIYVWIPPTQVAPVWAKRYKFVIKPDEEKYETIYTSIFFLDPYSNDAYFLLEGENSKKIETGERLIVKADSTGPTTQCVYATVLEKESKAADFITVPSTLDPSVNLPVPSGVYMKINPNSFNVVNDELAIIAPGKRVVNQDNANEYPLLGYPMNRYDTVTSAYVDYSVPAGSRIRLYFKFERLGTGDGNNRCERRIYTLDKTLVASANYDNMVDWWNGDNVQAILNDGISDVGGNNCAVDNQYIPTITNDNTDIPTALCTNYYRFYRDLVTNQLLLLVTGTNSCSGAFAKTKRRSSVTANVEVFRADTTLIFETQPIDALPDVFFENDLSFSIDANGNHNGNVQNQNIALGQPAIIDTKFFNCFAFGNGAESYKIRDSIVGRPFNLGNRVTAVSKQDYRRVDRFADITYSGIYNDESNLNRLNEFNLGILNFKTLEDSFGPIYTLDGRRTDVLVLQEDKISYVLAGKNLLSDAAAGSALTSVPEVLGTQIARVEKYGISFNPESYVQWGYDRYFTDVKRGVVLQLKGDSYANDQLAVVSEFGMRTWFRDEFITSFNNQKLGGYDPYMDEYVLVLNEIELPAANQCLSCGVSQTFSFFLPEGSVFNYCVNAGPYVGELNINYTAVVDPGATFNIEADYNSNIYQTGYVNTSGVLNFNKNSNSEDTVNIQITTTGIVTLTVTVDCPVQQLMSVIEVMLTSNSDAGQTIHAQYRYVDGAYISPLQSAGVTFISGTESPLVSRYNVTTGPQGAGNIPTDNSTVSIISNKLSTDTFDFDPASDKFRYLRTNVLYENNAVDINALIAASNLATPITTTGNVNQSTFNSGTLDDYLYLIWDLRASSSAELCFSDVNIEDVCCSCGPCTDPCSYYMFENVGETVGQVDYIACAGGPTIPLMLPPHEVANICAQNGTAPIVIAGDIEITVIQECGCPS